MTPRTDEMLKVVANNEPWELDILKCVPAEFARDLEKENVELLAACDEALNTLIECCVPAGGIDDQKHLLDAQRTLRTAIAKVTK